MSIIIGGPPSTGSSLLSRILDRHTQIACFQETHLLGKKQLFTKWETHKSRLQTTRLFSPGWHMYNSIDFPSNIENYGSLLESSSTVCDFASTYFSSLAADKGKSRWAEKTPLNIYFFHSIHKDLPDARFLFTIRNPYDTIASLILRGKSVLDAVALTLLNLGVGFLQKQEIHVLVVKYEELVRESEQTVKAICQYINVDFEANQLKANDQAKTKMRGWKHFEDGQIETTSLDRFKELTGNIQKQVIHLSHHLYIHTKHLNAFQISNPHSNPRSFNLQGLLKEFDYPQLTCEDSNSNYNPSLLKNRVKRLLNLHPSALIYPLYYE